MPLLQNLTLPEFTFREEIITPLGKLLELYIEQHSKVLVVRFDVHFPSAYPQINTNKYISELIAYIVKKYNRQGLDPKYFWTMERNHSVHPHYHVVLFLDGQKVRSYSHVFQNVEQAWERTLGTDVAGCIHHCNLTNGKIDMNRNGLQIHRYKDFETRQAQQQAVYNQISYLAKDKTKSHSKDGLRNFGMSRVPKPIQD